MREGQGLPVLSREATSPTWRPQGSSEKAAWGCPEQDYRKAPGRAVIAPKETMAEGFEREHDPERSVAGKSGLQVKGTPWNVL